MGGCTSSQQHPGEDYYVIPESNVRVRVRNYSMFGWKKDDPDFRDRILALPPSKTTKLPSKVELRPKDDLAVLSQGDLGSCTATAIAAAISYSKVGKGHVGKTFSPSRLFIYYNQRTIEDTIDEDAGGHLRDGLKSCFKLGVCSERMWPYEVERLADRPTSECFVEALTNMVEEYARVPQTLDDLKGCLNAGLPVIFGFTVLSSFMTKDVAQSGKMPMPQRDDKVLGGHAAVLVGYDDDQKAFLVRNSWGREWGLDGYFYMPYTYITWDRLAADFWAIRLTQDGKSDDFPTKQL